MISNTTLRTVAAATAMMLGTAAFGQTAAEPITPEHNRTQPGNPGGQPGGPVTGTNTIRTPANAAETTADNAMSMRDGMTADKLVQQQYAKIASAGDKAPDMLFTLKAACGNMWETELSRVVSERAQDQQVKEIAQQMVNDHTQANTNLQSAAQAQGLQLPTSLESTKQSELSVYRNMPADKLEQCYLAMLKADHAKDVTSYALHQKMAQNDQLKQYINQTLPKLREHAQHVSTVAQAKGVTGDGMADTSTDMTKEVK